MSRNKKQSMNKNTKIKLIVVGVVVVFFLVPLILTQANSWFEFSGGTAEGPNMEPVVNGSCDFDSSTLPNTDLPAVLLCMEDFGAIVLELYPQYAPITVDNFMELVDSGFYDGIVFHRIIAGFMMQGGDPTGTGMGGSDTTIFGEVISNGWADNTLSHERGVISMAHNGNPNNASSQFFIMHAAAPHLDGLHPGFGRVVHGLDVVDAIVASVTPTDGNGSIAPDEQPVIQSAHVVNRP